MTLEEKKALAYAESEAWEREVGLKPPADEKQPANPHKYWAQQIIACQFSTFLL